MIMIPCVSTANKLKITNTLQVNEFCAPHKNEFKSVVLVKLVKLGQ